MEPVRRAIIDIGTNSVKLLVADVASRQVIPIWEGSEQTRLGRGFYETHRLSPAAVAATGDATANFAKQAGDLGAITIRVIATSAARDARNIEDLVRAVRSASGLEIEILSGEQEADLTFQGVTTDSRYANSPIMLLEVGGGSSQFILGEQGARTFARSFQIGTVRLMEAVPHVSSERDQELAQTREWLKRVLDEEVASGLDPELRRMRQRLPPVTALQLVGTGGTVSILGCIEAKLDRFDRDRLELVSLNIDRLQQILTLLWSLSLAERKSIVGLPANRADVILTGAAIYEAIMTRFGFQELHISTRGLRFGAALSS